MLKSKIHRATVTHADLNYEGSISIPRTLLLEADILEYEEVWVWNVTNGARFATYAIECNTSPSEISVNGAAAHLVNPGDIIIIASFIELHQSELSSFTPKLVFVDADNQIKPTRKEIAGPARPFLGHSPISVL
ncbi:MAG: aspartate 1-decarboxylase [Bdellovibrionales bacterium]|nr:aspartate 1-decarboxylase [Bdellovibrionales bacterium]